MSFVAVKIKAPESESKPEVKFESEEKPKTIPEEVGPKIEVKSAAEYLKEFQDFYKDESFEVKVKEEIKKEAKFKEKSEEEIELKEKEEGEFKQEGSVWPAAPQVRPFIAPPDPLELCEDLDNAVYEAEQ